MPQPFCFDEDGYPLEQCNECGLLVPLGNDLCGPCGAEEELEMRLAALSDPNEGCWSYNW
jgi:hypothetical protein